MAILIALVDRAGQDVTKEELKNCAWPDDTFVEFEYGITTAIRKIRQALGDSVENPIFIRTLHRRGYRFIAPVYLVTSLTSAASPQESLPSLTPAPAEPVLPAYRTWILLTAGVLVLAAGGAAIWMGTRPKPPVADRMRPFATAKGRPSHPAFSPDGGMLAFDWTAPPDRNSGIYIQRMEATSPVRLREDAMDELHPVWSPDGTQIAFLRDSGNWWSIITAPLVGREERKWADFRKGATPWLDWSRDGKWFVFAEATAPNHPPSVVLLSLATGEKRTITNPPAAWHGDSEAVFSPDSTRVAFRRTKPPSGDEDIYIVPVTGGEPLRTTFDDIGVSGFMYTPDGGLLFSSLHTSSIHRLWWKPPNNNRFTHVTSAAVDAVAPAVSRDGRHLAYTQLLWDVNIWRASTDGSGAATPLIDSELPDRSPRFSPDGRHIAFQSVRSGTQAIWVCDSNGANAVMLSDGRGFDIGNPRWSPDGRQIAFEWVLSGKAAIYVMSSGGGASRPLVSDAFRNSVPTWTHDGRFVYFSSNRGGDMQIWKIPEQGGAPEQITRHQGFAGEESPDGNFLYFLHGQEVWRLPLNDGAPSGAESIVVSSLMPGDWGNWAATDGGVYYIQRGNDYRHAAIVYQEIGSNHLRTIHVMAQPPVFGGGGLTISPDGKTILFAQVDRDDTNIFVQ